MTFRNAAESTEAVARYYRDGLRALPRVHRDLLRISDTRRLDGSIHIDQALLRAKPNDPRWDYGVGIRLHNIGLAVWVEVHPASSSHVDPVLAKLAWLRRWLEKEAPALGQVRARYVWLATGTVALPANSPKRKLIAQHGLDFRAKFLDLDKFSG
jgi:hypothetical protein